MYQNIFFLIKGIDTRSLTQKIREQGTMLGRVIYGAGETATPTGSIANPNKTNLVSMVSTKVRLLVVSQLLIFIPFVLLTCILIVEG